MLLLLKLKYVYNFLTCFEKFGFCCFCYDEFCCVLLFRMVRSGLLVLEHLILLFQLRNVPSMLITKVLLKVSFGFISTEMLFEHQFGITKFDKFFNG